MRKGIALWVIFVATLQAFSYVNFGVGFMYTDKANFGIRLGYNDPVDINFDYFLNDGFKLYGFLGLNTTIGLQVGPSFGVFGAQDIAFYIGGGVKLKLTNMELTSALLLPSDFEFTNIRDSLLLTFKYFLPDPPGMKMRDKLYIEIGYVNNNFSVFVGLLEPF